MDKQNLACKNFLLLLVIALWPIVTSMSLPERCRMDDKSGFGCLCDDGFQKLNGTCVPICEPACGENFKCIDKNTCDCIEDYELEADRCVPIEKCDCPQNSHATDQQSCECECDMGYAMFEGTCRAVCEPKCSAKEICFAPNRCLNKKRLVHLTDGTYEPLCSIGCGENERCIDFGRCDCKEGATRNNITGKCEFHCEPACGEFSHCIASNVCKCSEGYFSFARSCYPVCHHCEENEKCIAPEKCACEKGYQETVDGCESICEAGYRLAANNIDCEPICQEPCGDHQFCSEPNVCACVEGYKRAEGNKCLQTCGHDCGVNEVCNVASNQCECKPSFIRSSNHCVCAPGYNLMNETCKPECLPSCGMHATCTSPHTCECLNGNPYVFSQSDHCNVNVVLGDSSNCFKSYHIVVTRIKLHCDTSSLVIVLIYGCICILPLVAIFFGFQAYRKFRPKCQQKPAATNLETNFSTTHQRLILE